MMFWDPEAGYMMERKGDVIPIISKENRETAGIELGYKLVHDSRSLLLPLSAKSEPVPSDSTARFSWGSQ